MTNSLRSSIVQFHRWRDSDEGSSLVEFILVLPMVLLVGFAIFQIALTMFIRTTITSAAAEGARVAALSGSSTSAGTLRTRRILDQTIAANVVQRISTRSETANGVPTMTVSVDARLPLVGLLGPTQMRLVGHAVREG